MTNPLVCRRVPGRDGPRPPHALGVAVLLAGFEALVFVVLAVAEMVSLRGEALVMGVTTLSFFLAYGLFLGWAAWQLWRLQSWSRAPIVLAQLIQILVGASFWGGSTSAVAVVAVLVAVAVLAGIFSRSSLAALDPDRTAPDSRAPEG